MLLGLVGDCQCHLWPYNAVHTYVCMSMQLLLCVCFMCENKYDDDDDILIQY